MRAQSVKTRSVAPLDVVERVLNPADREQEGDAGCGALGVRVIHAIKQAPQCARTAERADDREVEIAMAKADITPVEQAGERAARGVVQQMLGLDVGVQRYRCVRTRLEGLERLTLAGNAVELGGFEHPGKLTLQLRLSLVIGALVELK